MKVRNCCPILCVMLLLAAYAPNAVSAVDGAADDRNANGRADPVKPRSGQGASEISDIASAITGTPGDVKPEAMEPLFVRPLTKIEAGHNDSNPQWSPSGNLIAFERSTGDKKEIFIMYPDGTLVDTVYYQLASGSRDSKFFFPGLYEDISYNSGISWAPGGDRFVFMSNGGEGNYDLYLQELGMIAERLTDHKEKDGQGQWSPAADRVVFVSGRSGNGDLYLMDLATRAVTRLTRGGKPYLYPQWSPDGKNVAVMHGSNENHDIVVVSGSGQHAGQHRYLTTWPYDDLRPVWSPDGKRVAFYSNYNSGNDAKAWSILVVSADGSDPTEGDGLALHVVATDVIPDMDVGPAWTPDGRSILYVKNDRQEYNPLYLADVARRTNRPIRTDTRMNHDVSCSRDGMIAFRAQANQWDRIYVMKLK